MNIHHCRVCKLISISFIFLSFLIFFKDFSNRSKKSSYKNGHSVTFGGASIYLKEKKKRKNLKQAYLFLEHFLLPGLFL